MCYTCKEFTIDLPSVYCDANTDLLEVLDISPINHRRAVEQIARYFQMEMKYDFIQYAANQPNGGGNGDYLSTISYLFMDTNLLHFTKSGKSTLKASGACCFKKKQNKKDKDWELDWVWIHPFQRRQGILTSNWSSFKRRFGEFTCCKPLSYGMEKFLAKTPHQKNYF